MIPDFKTYIKESIWSDIQDRSSGEIIRKEDENFFKTIATYIQIYVNREMFVGRYQFGVMSEFMHFINDYANNIKIEPLNPDIDMIKRYVRENWESLEDVFLDLHKLYKKYVTLDDVMEMMKSKCILKESIWSDIQDRSSGEIERKEDDVNNLDMQGLLEYIQKKYEFSKEVITLSSSIGIPLFSYKSSITYLTISYTFSKDRIYDVYSRFLYDSPLKDSVSSMLKQKYSVKIRKENSISKYDGRHFALISTKPKKGDIDNRFVIDVIDTYIDIMDTLKDIDKYIKRK